MSVKGATMTDWDTYLENKQTQINSWIGKLARLDALYREAGDDVRIKFEVKLKEFSENLDELNVMFREYKELNEYGREKLRQLIEKNWRELEESFKSSISEYEHLISTETDT